MEVRLCTVLALEYPAFKRTADTRKDDEYPAQGGLKAALISDFVLRTRLQFRLRCCSVVCLF
jgi:hypothetical protein